MMLVIVIPLGIGGGERTRTRTAAMMTKQKDAACIIRAPPQTAANIAIITAVADAHVVVKDDLVFTFGTITTTSYVIPTPGWAIPLPPLPAFVVVIIVIIVIVAMASSPLVVVNVVILVVNTASCFPIPLLCPNPLPFSLCCPPPVHPFLLTNILFFPGSPLEVYLPSNPPLFCYSCVGNIIYHKKPQRPNFPL